MPEDLINNSEIKIFNMIGKQLLIKQVTTKKIHIDLYGYSNGLYFIKIESNNSPVQSLKIILNKIQD